jgi:hypothetical protein
MLCEKGTARPMASRWGVILGLFVGMGVSFPLNEVLAAGPVRAVAWRPDGRLLAVARGSDVLVVNGESRAVVATLATDGRTLNALAWSRSGDRLAAAEGVPGVEGAVRVWTLSPGGNAMGEAAEWVGQTDSLYGVAFTPDAKSVLTCGYDRLLQKWDASTGQPAAPFVHHTAPVFGLSLSPDGKFVASVAGDSTLKVWSVETTQRLATLTESTKTLSAVTFSPKGDEIVAAGEDRMVRVWGWNGTVGKLRRGAFAHDGAILAVAYNPDGMLIYSAGDDGRVKAWDALAMRERHVYADLGDWPQCLAVSPDGRVLVIGLHNGKTLFVNARSADRIGELTQAIGLPWRYAGLVPALLAQAPTAPKAANPLPPRLDAVSPRMAARGKKVTVTFSGLNLWNAEELVLAPDLKHTVLPGDMAKPNQRQVEVELPADFQPGTGISFRWQSAGGGTSLKTLTVLAFPEVAEQEKKGTTVPPVPVTLPATLRGTIISKGDVDDWVITAKAGQELSLQLLSSSLGSVLAPVLSIRNDKGEPLASTSRLVKGELLLGYRFEQAGTYTLRVEDRHFTGGGNHIYALHAGAFPLVTGLSSRGLRAASAGDLVAGEPSEIEVTGFNLGGRVTIPRTATLGSLTAITTPNGVAFNAVDYILATTPEFAESKANDAPSTAQLVPAPAAVSGRIEAASDRDHIAFDAKQGERLTIEVLAGRWGSRLDSFLEILTPEGQPVERATLRCVAETYTVLRDHDSKVGGIRLQAWDDFEVNDFLLFSGEVVKIRVLPLGPDEDTKFFEKGGLRVAQFGTTSQAHALSSTAYKVEVHPPGSTFPPNGMPLVPLHWANDDGERDFAGDSRILFDVPADGRYVVRLRDARGEGSSAHDYRLMVRPRAEGFRLSVSPENPNIPRGGAVVLAVTAERLDGFTGPIDVTATGLPTGVTALPARIGAEMQTTNLILAAAADAAVPTVDAARALQIRGTAMSATGEALEHVAPAPFGKHQVTLIGPPDLGVTVDPVSADIRPGQELRFTVKIERRGDLKARIPVDVINLPHGLRVLDVGLNGVLINEQETERSFVVICDPWAPAGEHPFYAAPRIEARQNERFPSAAITLRVVKPTEQSQAAK